MSDDQISVELTAKVDELQSGLLLAVNAMLSAVQTMRGGMGELNETAHETESVLKQMLSMEAFDFFKEHAEAAFEHVKEGFEATVVAAEEFGLSTAKFAAMMSTSQAEAAGLTAALRGVGVSAEAYEGIALKLEMGLRSNEERMNQLGVTTRNASGELLGGKELMDNAISTMGSYKAGTDANSFALEIFGRKAKDVFDITRVSSEAIEHQTEIYKGMGVNIDGSAESSQKLEEVMNDLHTVFDALKIKLGQELMPVATAFFEYMSGPEGRGVLEAMATSVKFLVTTFDVLKATVTTVVVAILGSLTEVWDALKLGGKLLEDLSTGNFGAMARDWKVSTSEMSNDASAMGKTISDEWDSVTAHAKAMWADTNKEAEKNPYIMGGGSKGYAPKGKKEKGGSGEDAEIKGEEKIALERVSLEEATNAHLLAMGRESVDQFIAQQKSLEDETYAIKSSALEQELTLHGRTKAQKQKTLEEMALLEEQHVDKLVRIEQDGETRKAAIAKETLANDLRLEDENLQDAKVDLAQLVEAGTISALQKTELEIQLTQTIRQEQIARLDAEMSTLDQTTKAYEDMVKQKEKLERQFHNDMKTLSAERYKDATGEVTSALAPITAGFKTAMSDMTQGGKTFAQAMQDVAKSIEGSMLSMSEKILEDFIIKQITASLVGKAQAAENVATQIPANAAIGGSGAFASQAGIPIVGPILGAAAAAATIAAILGFESIAHASGGMEVSHDQLAFVHKDEMVLPAHLSDGIRAMTSGGGASGGGATFNYAPVTNAPNANLAQLLRDHGDVMEAWFNQRVRDGAFRR
jgi:hypothetical protein